MRQPSEDYSNEAKDLTSDFNEAKLQIFRLNMLWISCQTLSQNGNYDAWKWKLDAVWRELAADAREKDGYGKDYSKWVTEGAKTKGKYINVLNELNEKLGKAALRDNKYKVLQEKEIFLRCLQDDVGKGSKKSSSEDDDIDE